jgi:hypothetical protein
VRSRRIARTRKPISRQTEAGSLTFFLGCEERIGHVDEMFRRDADAGVGDLDDDGRPGAEVAGPHQDGEPAAGGHGVAGVGEQVQEHLPELPAVGENDRQVPSGLFSDRPAPLPVRRTVQQPDLHVHIRSFRTVFMRLR